MRDECYGAIMFDELEEYLDAIEELDLWLTGMPQDYKALNNRGLMHWEIGQPEQAKVDLEAACSIASDDPLPHMNLGRFLEASGERDLAIASYRRALTIAPDNTYAQACLAGIISTN